MIHLRDLACYLITPTESISGVLRRINTSPYLFLVVIDEDGRLLGTVTDGDIRRAMLKGLSLDASVSACMQQNPKFGRIGANSENLQILDRVPSREQFLPIVNDAGRVVEILVQRPQESLTTAVVMAGGAGTRLGERTRVVAKPLLQVGARTILDRVIEGLETAGVRRIILAVHHLHEQFERFAAERRGLATLELLYEPKRLGTAGALGLLDASQFSSTRLLVVNGDLVTRVDYRALHEFHVRHGRDGTIGAANYRVDVPFGVIEHDKDGTFEGLAEKPNLNYFVAAGVYYLNPPFLTLVPKDQAIDMPDLLNRAKRMGLRCSLFPIHEEWADIGRPADIDAVDEAYRKAGL